MQARQIEIGSPWRERKNDQRHVAMLHELCHEQRTPHVHIVLSDGNQTCRQFGANVNEVPSA